MVRYLLTTTIFIIFFAASSFGQARITGKVIDSVSKAPVDFATISVFKAGAKAPINGVSADPKGNFTVTGLPVGDYMVSIDFIGYRKKDLNNIKISDASQVISLGTISLSPSTKQLAGVTVTSKVPIIENKIDKTVYNAANDLTAQGGVALDVLKKVPMLSVDIDGNVEFQGSSSVRFLINGKPSTAFGPSLANALQSIPASQIKSIEVITSPGAKYDAQGTGGIINIVLKDDRFKGFNGGVNLSAGTRLENGSVNLNARTSKFGVGLFFSGNKQLNTTTKNSSTRTSYDADRDTISRFSQDGSSPFTRSSYETGVNLTYNITPKDELTGTLSYSHFSNHSSGITNQYQQSELSSGNIFSDLASLRNSASSVAFNSTDISLGYKKTFKKEGQELNFLYFTSFGNNTFNATQNTSYPNGGYPTSGINSLSPGSERQTEITLDYAHP